MTHLIGTITLIAALAVHPTRIVVSPTHAALIDGLNNAVVVVNLANGRSERMTTSETPVDALFVNDDLFLLCRDAHRLETRDGRFVELARDPALMREANGRIYVYSRAGGVMQEIDPRSMRITRTLPIAPFASSFAVDGRTGYLTYPAEARLRTFSLATMKVTSDVAAGAVPIDIAVAARANALSASRVAIADPSAKRVWMIEGEQSVAKAVTRGFLRGLLGLGLFRPRSVEFPKGVDRVVARGTMTLAYDSLSRTLYRIDGSKANVIANDVEPGAFAIAERGVIVWQNGSLRLIH